MAGSTYEIMTETWEGMDTGEVVTRYAVSYNASPRRVEITQPDKTRLVELSCNEPGFFRDGLPYQQANRSCMTRIESYCEG